MIQQTIHAHFGRSRANSWGSPSFPPERALLAAGAVLAAYDYREIRQTLVTGIQTYANMVAQNCTAALSFGDANDAAQTLASSAPNPTSSPPASTTISGKKLASYFRGSPVPVPDFSPQNFGEHRFTDNSLVVTSPVEPQRPIPRLGLRRNPISSSCPSEPTVMPWSSALVLLCGLALALVLSRWLARSIVGPVQHLSKTAQTVTRDQNYKLRAAKVSEDELGVLVDCFNAMLGQIEQRDDQLNLHRHHLEELVAARTTELSTAKERPRKPAAPRPPSSPT